MRTKLLSCRNFRLCNRRLRLFTLFSACKVFVWWTQQLLGNFICGFVEFTTLLNYWPQFVGIARVLIDPPRMTDTAALLIDILTLLHARLRRFDLRTKSDKIFPIVYTAIYICSDDDGSQKRRAIDANWAWKTFSVWNVKIVLANTRRLKRLIQSGFTQPSFYFPAGSRWHCAKVLTLFRSRYYSFSFKV